MPDHQGKVFGVEDGPDWPIDPIEGPDPVSGSVSDPSIEVESVGHRSTGLKLQRSSTGGVELVDVLDLAQMVDIMEERARVTWSRGVLGSFRIELIGFTYQQGHENLPCVGWSETSLDQATITLFELLCDNVVRNTSDGKCCRLVDRKRWRPIKS